ncbi:hypothetical protein Glove_14g43 [Diversispora epigaea]|uniref:Uncharacterized protein n=1 Tax=Diversispora epigaea TaxID=1348612 RepID=A0A397JM34_9GLOM|nr:hypothetical protein Glove_14g43 [Diversispora epigaea]
MITFRFTLILFYFIIKTKGVILNQINILEAIKEKIKKKVPYEKAHIPWIMTSEEQKRSGCIIGENYPKPMVILEAWVKNYNNNNDDDDKANRINNNRIIR